MYMANPIYSRFYSAHNTNDGAINVGGSLLKSVLEGAQFGYKTRQLHALSRDGSAQECTKCSF